MARCSGCGAALSLTDGAVVRCQYCGTDNRVAPDPVRVAPPPVIVVQPPSPSLPSSSPVARWLVALLVLPLAIGGAVISALHKGGVKLSGGGTLASSLRKLQGSITWTSSQLCFVDGNGDDALDPVGFGGHAGQNDQVHALDGKTGAELWSSARFTDSKAWCGDRGTVLVAGGDFSLTALDGRTGKNRWQARLSDKAREVVAAGECVAVHTDDNEHAGFSLATGAPQKCVLPKGEKRRRGYGEPPEHVKVRSGDLDVELTAKRPGTPLLVLTARRGDQTAWKTTLNAQEITSDKRFLFADGGKLVVFGGAMPSNNHLVIVGVDAATGNVAYTKNEESPFSTSIFFEEAQKEGPWIIAHFGSELHAYDPATGDPVW